MAALVRIRFSRSASVMTRSLPLPGVLAGFAIRNARRLSCSTMRPLPGALKKCPERSITP